MNFAVYGVTCSLVRRIQCAPELLRISDASLTLPPLGHNTNIVLTLCYSFLYTLQIVFCSLYWLHYRQLTKVCICFNYLNVLDNEISSKGDVEICLNLLVDTSNFELAVINNNIILCGVMIGCKDG